MLYLAAVGAHGLDLLPDPGDDGEVARKHGGQDADDAAFTDLEYGYLLSYLLNIYGDIHHIHIY